MTSREDIAQKFIDAFQDESVYCDGVIPLVRVAYENEPVSIGPNCGARHDCPLFRIPPFTRVIRRFMLGHESNAEEGCLWFRVYREWIKSEQCWIVQFDGHEPQEVQARDATGAACVAWWYYVREGDPIDKMYLFDHLYTVRENRQPPDDASGGPKRKEIIMSKESELAPRKIDSRLKLAYLAGLQTGIMVNKEMTDPERLAAIAEHGRTGLECAFEDGTNRGPLAVMNALNFFDSLFDE